jgi:hypothetical protein
MRRDLALLAFALACVACFVAGCERRKGGPSRLTASVGGREIKAFVEGWAFLQPEDDVAILSFHSHKLAIDGRRVLLDGAEVGRLPDDATEIEILVGAGELSVSADGTAVFAMELRPGAAMQWLCRRG